MASSHWVDLPTEMWGAICAHLEPELESERILTSMGSLQHLPRLSAVCTKFQSTIAQLPHSVLFLPDYHDKYDAPAVVAQVQKYRKCLQTVVADCNSNVETALASLLSLQCPIRQAFLAQVNVRELPRNSIALLAQFTTLTACLLNRDAYSNDTPPEGLSLSSSISLLPLGNLPHLALLDLHGGTFEDLNAAMHLTSLKLSWCQVTCSVECSCVSSLVHLDASNTSISNFHPQGLSACSALVSLSCAEVYKSADNISDALFLLDDEHWTWPDLPDGHGEVRMPASLSTLTALTRMTFEVYMCDAHLQLSWLNSLPALQHISIHMDTVKVDLPSSFSNLTSLSYLQLVNFASEGRMQLAPGLADLVALETLSLHGQAVGSFGHDLSNLLALQRLDKVKLSGISDTCSGDTVAHVAMLASKLARHKQDVSLSVEYLDIA